MDIDIEFIVVVNSFKWEILAINCIILCKNSFFMYGLNFLNFLNLSKFETSESSPTNLSVNRDPQHYSIHL